MCSVTHSSVSAHSLLCLYSTHIVSHACVSRTDASTGREAKERGGRGRESTPGLSHTHKWSNCHQVCSLCVFFIRIVHLSIFLTMSVYLPISTYLSHDMCTCVMCLGSTEDTK